MSDDALPVRESEQLDWAALEKYVRPRLAEQLGDFTAPLVVEQFPGGHSNLTYLLRFGEREFALRRPPFGPVPARAHDMARECRILSAIHPVFPLAPKPYLLCEDLEVIGSTFYVMERRKGLIIRNVEPAEFDPDRRHRVSKSIVDTLADLHLIDVNAHGLSALGKPAGFVERQVRGWTERWHGSKTSEQESMEEVAKWLASALPPESPTTSLLHGDYKLDNIMLDHHDVAHLVAVFDWEMSALGDPLIDLGIFLAYWVHTAALAQEASIGTVTTRPGWFTREEIIERYASRTGFDLSNIRFYEVFAIFKLAVVLQQIFYRYHRGQTDDPRFAKLDRQVTQLAQISLRLCGNPTAETQS